MHKLLCSFYLLFFFFHYLLAQGNNINVYVILSEDCPICQYMGPVLSQLEQKYNSDVNFYAVFPVSRSNIKSISLFKKKNGLEGYKTIHDKDQILSHKLEASITPEAIITNSDDEIIFRGRINDAYHQAGRRKRSRPFPDLDLNIRKAINNIEIDKPWPKAVGCFITYNKLAG